VGTSGGYLGVDIFFVVSGFVITNLLVREVGTTDRVRLREFWARRARRIFPLLGVSLVVGLIGSALLLSPAGSQQQAAKTATAASLFSANGYLYAFGDEYFTPSSTNPFLHTWSLAVEEQTYLLLPLRSQAEEHQLAGRWSPVLRGLQQGPTRRAQRHEDRLAGAVQAKRHPMTKTCRRVEVGRASVAVAAVVAEQEALGEQGLQQGTAKEGHLGAVGVP
jgi:hypothetical protein